MQFVLVLSLSFCVRSKGCQMPIATDIKLDFHNPPHLNARMWARPYQKVSHMAAAAFKMTLRGTWGKIICGDLVVFIFPDSSSTKGKPSCGAKEYLRVLSISILESSPAHQYSSQSITVNCRLGPRSDWGLREVVNLELTYCDVKWSTHGNPPFFGQPTQMTKSKRRRILIFFEYILL